MNKMKKIKQLAITLLLTTWLTQLHAQNISSISGTSSVTEDTKTLNLNGAIHESMDAIPPGNGLLFDRLLTEGGFIVSERTNAGQSAEVSVTAAVDQRLRLVNPFVGKPFQSSLETETSDGLIMRDMKAEETLVIKPNHTNVNTHQAESGDSAKDFRSRILPPERTQLFTLPGWDVWDGSIIRDDKGKWHLFASRWPAGRFNQLWLTDSRLIRAESDNLLGPYEFREELHFPQTQPWSSNAAHNPKVFRYKGRYYMLYIGNSGYPDDIAKAREHAPGALPFANPFWNDLRFRQRSGIAVADDPAGPWMPLPKNPILDVRPDQWDAKLIVNPSACVMPDGRVLLIYKSTRLDKGGLHLGAAIADSPEGTFERVGPAPLFEGHVEDPCIWRESGTYRMLLKDMDGSLCGMPKGGVLVESADGLHWQLASSLPAYDLTIEFDGEPPMKAARVERVEVVLDEGNPVAISHAVLFTTNGKQTTGILIRKLGSETGNQ